MEVSLSIALGFTLLAIYILRIKKCIVEHVDNSLSSVIIANILNSELESETFLFKPVEILDKIHARLLLNSNGYFLCRIKPTVSGTNEE
jgi:hypothetical protein